jgi:hypothetical protein
MVSGSGCYYRLREAALPQVKITQKVASPAAKIHLTLDVNVLLDVNPHLEGLVLIAMTTSRERNWRTTFELGTEINSGG